MTPRILMGESGATVVDAVGAVTVADARAAVKELVVHAAGRPTLAVVGGLASVAADPDGRAALDDLGRFAVRVDLDRLVVIGEPLRALHLGAVLEGSWSEESVLVPDLAAATTLVAEDGDTGRATAVIGDDPGLATLVERLVSR